MKPEDVNSSQGGLPLSRQDPREDNSTQQTEQQYKAQQEAAAQIIRSQIDSIFDNNKSDDTNIVTSDPIPKTIEYENPYQRNHTEHPTIQTSDWKQYHSAWQNYYQKYYEGYYKHKQEKPKNDNSSNIISTDEAIFDIRQNIINKVHKSASKVKKSRHFIPILSGVIVVLIFMFLQYNRLIISNVMAYVSPGNIDPQNIIIDPNAVENVVSAESKLIIPKINVDVPVFYDVGSDYSSQMAAMNKGLAHFAIPGASSHPGQIGNTVLAGHSSNDLLDSGEYKFIFLQLEKLEIGDVIYANYQSKRYTYAVTKKEIVKPNDTAKLVYQTNIPVLTLVTCVPIGTANDRLLVTANQINPDPNQATIAPANEKTTKSSMPGNSPTFFERLFGAS